MQQIEFRAMNSAIRVVMDSDTRAAVIVLSRVPAWFAAWEQVFSRFRPDSELSQLNHNTSWTCVSDDLWAVLCAARHVAAWTDGLVTPNVLDALEAAGYDRSFETLANVPRQGAIGTAGTSTFLGNGARLARLPELDAAQRSVYLPHGTRLDLGGIAKGWAAQQAMQRLSRYGPVLVDAGGDIAMSARDAGWTLGVADPLHTGHCLSQTLHMQQGAVATSGRDYRRWRNAGSDDWRHHIIDPRTGCPAQTDVLSATVITPGMDDALLYAEAAAKVVLILGSQRGLTWLDAHPPLAGIVALDDGRVLRSGGMPDV